MNNNSSRKALVVGVTGISGQVIATQLMDAGWEVHEIGRAHV